MKLPIRQAVFARTLTILAISLVSACTGTTVQDDPLPVATVDVTPSSTLNLSVGATAQLTGIPKGSHGEQMTSRTVTWQSANSAVATVSATGQVTGAGGGSTQITATSEGKTSTPVAVVVTAGQIALSRTAVAFDALSGSTNPAAQTVSITNSGSGTLAGLTVGAIQYGAGQPTGWLTASLTPATAPSTLTLQPATGTLNAGTYTAVVPVTSTGAGNSPQNVTVTFVVNASVSLTIGGAGTGSGTVTVGGFTCTITNGAATGSCALRAAVGTPVVLTATPTGTSVFSGWSGDCTGTSTCSLTMSANRSVTAAFNPPSQTVIALSSSTVSFAAGQGGGNPPLQTVSISNGGAVALTGLAVSAVQYTAGQPTGWLSVGLTGTTAPADLNLQPTIGALAPGTYTATVNVTSPVASNSPATVTINLVVIAKPVVITFAATTVTFNSASLGGSVAQDGQPYSIFFEYGTNPSLPLPASSTSASSGPTVNCPGTVTCNWSQTLSGLISGTTYYYRIVATNAAGTSRGSIISFKTN